MTEKQNSHRGTEAQSGEPQMAQMSADKRRYRVLGTAIIPAFIGIDVEATSEQEAMEKASEIFDHSPLSKREFVVFHDDLGAYDFSPYEANLREPEICG